jgi:hypothetical protein
VISVFDGGVLKADSVRANISENLIKPALPDCLSARAERDETTLLFTSLSSFHRSEEKTNPKNDIFQHFLPKNPIKFNME